jgi:uncharacterized protein YjiS (DUF1127 family)
MHFLPLAPPKSRPYLPSIKPTQKHLHSGKKDKDMAAFDTTRTTYGSHGLLSRIGGTIATVIGTVSAWNDARITRNALSGLSDRELEDIGLIRGDIESVAASRIRY